MSPTTENLPSEISIQLETWLRDGAWNMDLTNMSAITALSVLLTLTWEIDMFACTVAQKGQAVMAEWLRRWTWNPMGFPRAGSNPAHSDVSRSVFICPSSNCTAA